MCKLNGNFTGMGNVRDFNIDLHFIGLADVNMAEGLGRTAWVVYIVLIWNKLIWMKSKDIITNNKLVG